MITVGPLVATGRTSDVYAYGVGAVVKVPRPDVPDHWAEKEARFTAAARRLGAPAPEVKGLVCIDGRDAIVFERIGGESMWDRMLVGDREMATLARDFAEVHRRILTAGLPTDLEGSVDRMCGKIAEATQLSAADRVEAQALVRSLPKGAALLHGDLHPANVLIRNDEPVVIDWFDASVGHPIFDVIRSSLLIRPGGGPGSPLHLPRARPASLARLHKVYVETLFDVLAVPDEVLRRWEAVVAASRLAEGAELDDSHLVALWHDRNVELSSPLVDAVSSAKSSAARAGADQCPE